MAESGRGEMDPQIGYLHIILSLPPCDHKNPLNHLSCFTGIFKPYSLFRLIFCNSPVDQTVHQSKEWNEKTGSLPVLH